MSLLRIILWQTGWLVALPLLFQHLTMTLSWMGGPSMLHCKQMPTFFSLHLSIFSLKRLKFGAQIAPPGTEVTLASCSGTVYVTSTCRITCLSRTDTANLKTQNSRQMLWRSLPRRKHQLKEKWNHLFWCVEQRELTMSVCPLSQHEVSLKAIALQQPQGKGAWLH